MSVKYNQSLNTLTIDLHYGQRFLAIEFAPDSAVPSTANPSYWTNPKLLGITDDKGNLLHQQKGFAACRITYPHAFHATGETAKKFLHQYCFPKINYTK